MMRHTDISDADVRSLIRKNKINFGGNIKLKIYGGLHCASGKRLKTGNRIFFTTESEAMQSGFRPCGHCMAAAYKKWKNGSV
jgi:methylphosphotriester-DNA--protein-cysteine methyltransferase